MIKVCVYSLYVQVCVFFFLVCVPHFPTLSIQLVTCGSILVGWSMMRILFTHYSQFTDSHTSSHKWSLHILAFIQYNVITEKIETLDPKTKLRQRKFAKSLWNMKIFNHPHLNISTPTKQTVSNPICFRGFSSGCCLSVFVCVGVILTQTQYDSLYLSAEGLSYLLLKRLTTWYTLIQMEAVYYIF